MALSQKDLGSIPGQSVLGKLLNLIGSQLLIYKAGEWYPLCMAEVSCVSRAHNVYIILLASW